MRAWHTVSDESCSVLEYLPKRRSRTAYPPSCEFEVARTPSEVLMDVDSDVLGVER